MANHNPQPPPRSTKSSDPRAEELLRRRHLNARPSPTVSTLRDGAVRCGACGGSVAINSVCRRCYPDQVVQVPAEKREPAVKLEPVVTKVATDPPPRPPALLEPRPDGRQRHDYPTEVKAAVDVIQARGEYPSESKIRLEMGGGDPGTISRTVKQMKITGEITITIPPSANRTRNGPYPRINYLVEVEAAVEVIQARGEYPSVDRIKAEMGGYSCSIRDALERLIENGRVVITTRPATPGPPRGTPRPVKPFEPTESSGPLFINYDEAKASFDPLKAKDAELMVIAALTNLEPDAQSHVLRYFAERERELGRGE